LQPSDQLASACSLLDPFLGDGTIADGLWNGGLFSEGFCAIQGIRRLAKLVCGSELNFSFIVKTNGSSGGERDDKKPLLLMIGFSHKSSGDFEGWNKQALSPYLSDPHLAYYELADLQGLPSFVKPMVLHGMRREIHGIERAHFVPFYAGEDEWKKAVSYSSSANTYLVLANSSGHIVWRTQGTADAEKISSLRAALAQLISGNQ
jgi:hypothetical protein